MGARGGPTWANAALTCTLGVLGTAPSDSDSLEEYTSGLWVPLARARDDRLAEEVTAPALQWDEVLAPVADAGMPFLEEAFISFPGAGLACGESADEGWGKTPALIRSEMQLPLVSVLTRTHLILKGGVSDWGGPGQPDCLSSLVPT